MDLVNELLKSHLIILIQWLHFYFRVAKWFNNIGVVVQWKIRQATAILAWHTKLSHKNLGQASIFIIHHRSVDHLSIGTENLHTEKPKSRRIKPSQLCVLSRWNERYYSYANALFFSFLLFTYFQWKKTCHLEKTILCNLFLEIDRPYKMMQHVCSFLIITMLSSIWNPVLSVDSHWVRLTFNIQTKSGVKVKKVGWETYVYCTC